MNLDVRLLGEGSAATLARVADGVFDDPLDPAATATFLADPRHHIAVALVDGVVVGFASAVHYVHPDKPAPELWINEVAVAAAYRSRGVGTAIVRALLEKARALGCTEAWVLTERDNTSAMRLYAGAGGQEADQDTVLFAFPLG